MFFQIIANKYDFFHAPIKLGFQYIHIVKIMSSNQTLTYSIPIILTSSHEDELGFKIHYSPHGV